MTLRVVGAGLGRTGTHSLKLALEQLLGAPCYHMMEVFGRPDDVPRWQAAFDGNAGAWDDIFDGYSAVVDWPAAPFWEPISAAYPDAIVLLSTRSSADAWYKSATDTIFEIMRRPAPPGMEMDAWGRMATSMLADFCPDVNNPAAAKAAYEAHNARAAPRRRPTVSSTGIPATAGMPSAPRSVSPFPTRRSLTSTPPTSSDKWQGCNRGVRARCRL